MNQRSYRLRICGTATNFSDKTGQLENKISSYIKINGIMQAILKRKRTDKRV
jgi:hypothetical protein